VQQLYCQWVQLHCQRVQLHCQRVQLYGAGGRNPGYQTDSVQGTRQTVCRVPDSEQLRPV
jgi:hypothetical protein